MKKKIFAVTLIFLMTLNLTACASKKESPVLPDIPNPCIETPGLAEEESMEAVPESDSTAEETASVDLSYNGGYEFPEKVTVYHCGNCDEQYANESYGDVLPIGEIGTEEYPAFKCHDMKINGHSFSDVNVYSSELDREYLKENEEYVIGEYEDDSVYIQLLKITDDGYYYGYLYDKTHPIRRTTGAVEYPLIYTYCPADPITMEDMTTALHAFKFTTVAEDDGNEHLHILPVVN